MNNFNRINDLLLEMSDDINYIKKASFIYMLKK